MNETGYIEVRGARVNNLQNIDVRLQRGQFIVMTGLSGSGKSSLAFDTLYAEGQRRYVESLSAYARQFLGRMKKPECDFIHGLPPAIAIEQKVVSRNPRSTVGTSTEIHDYLRLLFARVGHTVSPVSGCEVKRHTVQDVVSCALSYGRGTRFTVLAPITAPQGRTLEQQLGVYIQQGFSRIEARGEVTRIEDLIASGIPTTASDLYLLIDRLTVSDEADAIARLSDSAETAFFEGKGTCCLRFAPAGIFHEFSTRFEADGITFEEPNENMFAFNSPMGACPACEGFGRIIGISEDLVIPDSTRSVYEGAVVCWRGEKMSQWKDEFCRWASTGDRFPIFKPYLSLSRKEKDTLWHEGPACIDAFFKMVEANQYKIQYRVLMSRYRGKAPCPVCHGTRLRKEAQYVKVGGMSISDLLDMPSASLLDFFERLTLSDHEQTIAERLLTEIKSRLRYLVDVGLGYLTLSRPMNTLSGGESQRINLSKSLGSSLVGSMYVLDEPSIGLHSRDTSRLISVLKALRDLGNTVVVVEHDEEIIRAADEIVDLGPEAGRAGGRIVFQGRLSDSEKAKGVTSYTLDYLTGRRSITPPESRRPWNRSITVKGARANNLRGIDVTFPLNVMTVVTGVSGSGKSTLVRDIFYNAMKRALDEVSERPGEHLGLEGDVSAVQAIEFVDQNPIGKSTRSNPVTYVKAYDEIRRLFATLALSKQMNWTAGFFSFNTEGGRCEECKGEGTVTVEMQFMSDLTLTCDSCHGKRFKPDVLEARYHGKNIYDILCMTVNAAIEFFSQTDDGDSGEQKQTAARVVSRLRPLQEVGLGYITLGQSSSTLSGGENQRVKLAYHIGDEKPRPTVFIFDEPTTGLHFHDTHRLLRAFNALISRGHTVICIEHNLDVAACADHIIDLGPEAGSGGGSLVACGTPEEIVRQNKGYTAKYLKNKLR